jgi:hypothetical protein
MDRDMSRITATTMAVMTMIQRGLHPWRTPSLAVDSAIDV